LCVCCFVCRFHAFAPGRARGTQRPRSCREMQGDSVGYKMGRDGRLCG
jgi:hypothetical protein